MPETGSAVPTSYDSSRPNIARVYDYVLGGKDNFAVDRAFAEELLARQPNIRRIARANRAFMQRVVRAVAVAGVTQFLDIGTGLPTGENVHQIARSVASDPQVLYIDNDEVVAAHARALLASDPGVEFALADLRQPADVLAHAATTLDLTRPVAVLIISMLHFVPDDAQAAAIVRALAEPLVSGSYLAISHGCYRPDDEEVAKQYGDTVHVLARRGEAQIAALLPSGWEPIEPGLVPVTAWRPPTGDPAVTAGISLLGVVARKP